MEQYEYWFANLYKLTSREKIELREKVNTAKELYAMSRAKLRALGILPEKKISFLLKHKSEWELEREYEVYRKSGATLVLWRESSYPEKLKKISAPPYGLYVRGKLPDPEYPTVAIVGARLCSAYGRRQAEAYGAELAKAGVQIISGLALGIDGFAQQAAINQGGNSFGVLGCGVDRCYPREHIGLYMRLLEQGGLLSELPLKTPPLSRHFPARNRLISGLADAVLVIEAKEKSGSLITADMAMEQGRDVYALPGLVTSPLSNGCHKLIQQGAGILLSPSDFLEEMKISVPKKMKNLEKKEIRLESAENMVYSCLDFIPQNLEKIAQEVKLKIPELMDVLLALELKGYIKEVTKNYYVKL